MNTKWTSFSIAAVLCVLTVAAASQDFSASIMHDGNSTATNKIYVTKDKVRVDSVQSSGQGGIAIVNFSTQISDVLLPERKIYLESAQGQGPAGQRTWAFFRVEDVENACPDWQKLSSQRGGTCQKVGHETVNGRNTVKYTGTSSSGSGTVWLDSKLAFPIKWEGKNGGGELKDIKEEPQPASLFEIPVDYQKMQMPAGMPGMPRAH